MNTPPKLYRAITSPDFAPSGIPSRTFTTRSEAQEWLEAILDDWHEGIAFESDRHHEALDSRFWSVSKVECF